MNSEDEINSRIATLDAEDAALQLNAERIRRREKDLEVRQRTVDAYSQESVDAYNALLPEHENLVAEYNRRVATQNSAVRLTNSSISQFNSTCAKRCYYDYDMDAILEEKEQAQKRSAQPRDGADRQ